MLFVTLHASAWDTLSGLIQQPEPGAKDGPGGVTERGFTFRPAHCVDEDVVLVDLVLVMLEFLLQARQLLVGKLPGAFCLSDRRGKGLCETHAGLPSVHSTQAHTLFHSLSSLGSSKVSPSLTSWSFRELLSTDRVSLFPSIPYLVRITAQPNTDALDSLVKGAGLTPSREEAPI